MKKHLLIILLSALSAPVFGQAVTVSPDFPTSGEPITLTFDVTQSADPRAAGLIGLSQGEVFLWSGAGFGPTGDSAFVFGPPGQTDFSQPFPPGEMTSLGNDRWEITITPDTYFDLPDTVITYLGLLLKNSNGSAQTEDFFVPIFQDGEYNTRLVSPVGDNLVVDENEVININFLASEPSSVEIFVDDVSVATFENSTNVDFDLVATGSVVTRDVRVMATSGENTAETSFTYTILGDPTPQVLALPAGLGNGINYDPDDDTKVTLVLEAPQREFVFAVGSFNDWRLGADYLMNRTPDGNTYWIELTGLSPEIEYIFQYWVDDRLIRIGDPYADKVANPFSDPFIPESVFPNLIAPETGGNGIATTFQTGQEPFIWGDSEDSYVKPAVEDLIIYETFMGDFLQSHDFKDMVDTLDYFERLGINAIELMPVTEQGFDPGWGYDPDYMFATEKFYGTAFDYKTFIQECHSRGIAVILDIVLNHQTGSNPYNILYRDPETGLPSEGNPLFNPTATHPFNVFEDINHESLFAQNYVDSVVQYWIAEFHFDGYRFDLSKGFTQNEGNDPDDIGAWNAFDQRRIDILTRINNKIREVDETAYVILEHFSDRDEEEVLSSLGMLPWGNFHGAFTNLVTANNINAVSGNDIDNRTRVNYLESHDEQRLVYDMLENGQSSGDYNIRDLDVALERTKMAAAFFFVFPGPKMMWQWMEYGYDLFLPFDNPGRTDPKANIWNDLTGDNGIENLNYYNDPARQRVYDAYSAILGLRRDFPEVFKTESTNVDFTGAAKSLVFQHEIMDVVIAANFGTMEGGIDVPFPNTGTWYDFFSGDSINVKRVDDLLDFEPGEFHIFTSERLEKPVSSRLAQEGVNLVPFEVEFVPSFARLGLDEVLVEEGDTIVVMVTNEVPVQGDQQIRIVSNNTEDIRIEDEVLTISDGDISGSTRIFVIDDDEPEAGRDEIEISLEAITSGITIDPELGILTFQIGGSDIVTEVDPAINNNIVIYPNPAGSQIQVSTGNLAVSQLKVLHLLGTEVEASRYDVSSSNGEIAVDLTGLSNGVYLLELVGENFRSVSRFVINR